jgi:hypothetical protein
MPIRLFKEYLTAVGGNQIETRVYDDGSYEQAVVSGNLIGGIPTWEVIETGPDGKTYVTLHRSPKVAYRMALRIAGYTTGTILMDQSLSEMEKLVNFKEPRNLTINFGVMFINDGRITPGGK